MSHDRARLSALVDGELDHDARDRVLAHLAQCDECRAVVETERRVKALLSGMPEAAPGGDFLARLNSLGDPGAEPVVEPPSPAKRRMVGRRTGSKRSGTTQPMPPTAQATESGQPTAAPPHPTTGVRTRLGGLRLRLPVAGAVMAERSVADEASAGRAGADEHGAGARSRRGGLRLPGAGAVADEAAAGVSEVDGLVVGDPTRPLPTAAALATDGSVAGEASAGEPGADELGAGVRTPGGFALGVLRLPPAAAAAAADGAAADEAAAEEFGAAVRAPGGFPLGVLRVDTPQAEASDVQPAALSADETTTAEVRAGEPYAGPTRTAEPAAGGIRFGEPSVRRARGPFGGSTRPAASRPSAYPDTHGSRRPGRLRAAARLRSSRFGRRFTVGVAGAASLAGMALVTAFTVGGTGGPTTADVKVVPPIQRYTVQHADSAVNLPYSDPGAATATIGDSNLTGLLSPNR